MDLRNVIHNALQKEIPSHFRNCKMETLLNKITLNLDDSSEVSVKGFITPIEYTGSNFHVEWDALANLRVAESEKQYAASVFLAFLPHGPVSVGELWQIEPRWCFGTAETTSVRPTSEPRY